MDSKVIFMLFVGFILVLAPLAMGVVFLKERWREADHLQRRIRNLE